MNPYNGFTPQERMATCPWLRKEYDSGRRQKPTQCEVCLQTEGLIEPHAEDYSKPYGDHICQFGLCYRCHMILHCRMKSPEAFRQYCRTLKQGYRYLPLHSRSFTRFAADHLRGTGSPDTEKVSDGPLPGFEAILVVGRRVMAQKGVSHPLQLPGEEPIDEKAQFLLLDE